jgi:hypothetical protein
MLINKTPHPITIVNGEGDIVLSIAPDPDVIRLLATTVDAGTLEFNGVNIPVTRTVFGESKLPPESPGIDLIVSQLVLSAHPERKDLLVPSQVRRDKEGNIIGCLSLGRS